MEVRNAILQALRLSKMYTIHNSRVWGRDYITGQRNVQKLDKQIDAIKFICNHFLDLLPLQNLNVMYTSVLWCKEVWHIKHMVNFISMRWWEVPSYLPFTYFSSPYSIGIIEGPKIEDLVKEHSSDAVMFGWDAKKRLGNGKNIRNVMKRLNGFGLQMDSSILFLKATAMKMMTLCYLVH